MNDEQKAKAVERLRANRGKLLAGSCVCACCEGEQYLVAAASYLEAGALVRLHEEGGHALWDRLADVVGEDAEWLKNRAADLGLDHDEYAQGFLDGVAGAWSEIEDAVDSDGAMTMAAE